MKTLLGILVVLVLTFFIVSAVDFPQAYSDSDEVLVVIGSENDRVAAELIASSLEDEMQNRTGNITGGDFFRIRRTSDFINIGESLNTVISRRITDDDLDLLNDVTYKSDDNQDYDYEQYINLAPNLTLTWFEDRDYREDEPTIGFHIQDD